MKTIIGTATGIGISDRIVDSVTVRLPDGKTQMIDCALLVDASGPAAATSKWLQKAGFPAPKVERYDPQLRCALSKAVC